MLASQFSEYFDHFLYSVCTAPSKSSFSSGLTLQKLQASPVYSDNQAFKMFFITVAAMGEW